MGLGGRIDSGLETIARDANIHISCPLPAESTFPSRSLMTLPIQKRLNLYGRVMGRQRRPMGGGTREGVEGREEGGHGKAQWSEVGGAHGKAYRADGGGEGGGHGKAYRVEAAKVCTSGLIY